MKQEEPTGPITPPTEAQRQNNRKPYRKPTVRYEQVFETRALSCGKVNSTQGACHYQRKSS